MYLYLSAAEYNKENKSI